MGKNTSMAEYYEEKFDSNDETVTQLKLKIESALECLISYKIDTKLEVRKHMESFFEELKKFSGDLETLSHTGIEYENRLQKFDEVNRDTHEFFSVALEGIAKAREGIKQLEFEIEHKNDFQSSGEDFIELEREYTNMTSNGRVLIVDDDILILSIMNRALEMRGYEVIVTSNPHEVGDIVNSKDIDLAIVDLIMPELDGFQVFENIRVHSPELPIVFLTGRDHTETKIDALKRGAEDYIVKPFKVEEVLARIDGIMKRKSTYKFNINIDELTGAYTRKCFASKITGYLANAKAGKPVALSFMDLDKFKSINDTYGHLVGDEILKRFVVDAKTYLEFAKIFRFGGDEFLLLIENSSEEEAKEILESFREQVNGKDHKIDGIEDTIKIGLSIGLTELKPHDQVSKLLDRADKALYKAKESGRNQTVAYSDIVKSNICKKKILIVDAENVASNIVKSRLKSLDYSVKLADELEDIEVSLKKDMDLVILDFKTYRENKEKLDDMDILKHKVLLMISESERKQLRPSDVFEIDEIVMKPVSVNEVEKKVRKMMS